MSAGTRWAVVLFAAAAFALLALVPWHADAVLRRAVGVVAVTLILWVSEIAPLGVVALGVPVLATLAGVLRWNDAIASWGESTVFLFLGAFLLARALEKHGVFEPLLRNRLTHVSTRGDGWALVGVVLLAAGALSVMQNNTAVTAMLLPVVLALARRTVRPALALLALSYGATFGGMATPVGTAPNFIGFAEMRRVADDVNFLSWMSVGVPVWIGTAALGALVLRLVRRFGVSSAAGDAVAGERAAAAEVESGAAAEVARGAAGEGAAAVIDGRAVLRRSPASGAPFAAPSPAIDADTRRLRRIAMVTFAAVAVVWLGVGVVQSATSREAPARQWTERFLPESLPPVLASVALFFVRVGPRRVAVLDRRDFQALDWDTLFLIAGGLSLGEVLRTSGAAAELAHAVAGLAWPALALMLALGAVTVLLSELTSNTATASLMVPLAASLAGAVGVPPVQMIYIVALSASLGFALPISTPPNAIVYGTREIPLRLMIVAGVLVDGLALLWVVSCVRWLA